MKKIGRSHNSISRAIEFCGVRFSSVCFLESIAAGHKGLKDTIL